MSTEYSKGSSNTFSAAGKSHEAEQNKQNPQGQRGSEYEQANKEGGGAGLGNKSKEESFGSERNQRD